MNVRQWVAWYYDEDVPTTRRVAQQIPHTVAWLRAAWRTFPAFMAIVFASTLAGLDVSQVVLAVTWPTLTVLLLAVTDKTDGSDSTNANTGRLTE